MYIKSTNEIYFPHIIPGSTIGGKVHTWKNNVNGGAKKIVDLCLNQNSFFGGNVLILGLIKEYGFYACQHIDTQEIIGFYVSDPHMVTELGKMLLSERFPNTTIKYEVFVETPPTPEQLKDLAEMKQYGLDHGISPIIVEKANAEEIKSCLASLSSGKAEKQMASVETAVIDAVEKNKIVPTHSGELSPSFLQGRPQPKGRPRKV
jgi:hypothetical protein